MGQTDPNATQKYPQDIHQYIKATTSNHQLSQAGKTI
jgi:hypothetical protein